MRSTRIQQLGSAVALAGMASLIAMPALADNTISDTGPGSYNEVTNTTNNTVTVSNDNNVTVTNSNNQTATTGSAKVEGNTTAGSAMSGNASNSNNVSTTVAIGNGSGAPVVGSGSGSGGGSGSGAGAGSGSPASASSAGRGNGSSATGRGGSVAMLPATGCNGICDVSALRAAYKPFGGSTATTLKSADTSSALLTGLAVLLSLMAAGGSAYYSTKQRAKA